MMCCKDCGCWIEQLDTEKVWCRKYGQLVSIEDVCLDDKEIEEVDDETVNKI